MFDQSVTSNFPTISICSEGLTSCIRTIALRSPTGIARLQDAAIANGLVERARRSGGSRRRTQRRHRGLFRHIPTRAPGAQLARRNWYNAGTMPDNKPAGLAEGDFMTMPSSGSSPPALSHTDRFAASWTDLLLLAGRVLIGWLFLKYGWDKLMNMSEFVADLTDLKTPRASLLAWLIMLSELVIGIALILGVATRYIAVYGFFYLIIAFAIAYRYWEFPIEEQSNQFNHFIKNVAIMLFLFVTGGGRYSVDAWLTKPGGRLKGKILESS